MCTNKTKTVPASCDYVAYIHKKLIDEPGVIDCVIADAKYDMKKEHGIEYNFVSKQEIRVMHNDPFNYSEYQPENYVKLYLTIYVNKEAFFNKLALNILPTSKGN